MPDVKPAGDEEEIAAAVPVYGGQFDSITVDIDDIAAMGAERDVHFGAHYWFWMLGVDVGDGEDGWVGRGRALSAQG